jgi:dihydroorotate dehydrogenase
LTQGQEETLKAIVSIKDSAIINRMGFNNGGVLEAVDD